MTDTHPKDKSKPRNGTSSWGDSRSNTNILPWINSPIKQNVSSSLNKNNSLQYEALAPPGEATPTPHNIISNDTSGWYNENISDIPHNHSAGKAQQEEKEKNLNASFIQREAEYKAQIEQWENELLLERQITTTIQRDPEREREYDKCRECLNDKLKIINQLQNTNRKQKNALDLLSKEMKTQEQKEKNSKRSINAKNSNVKPERRDDDPLNIILRVKDKEWKNAVALWDTLSKDNEEMKKAIALSGGYDTKLEWDDDMKIKEDRAAKLQEERKMLWKQWQAHKKCEEEQSNIWDNIKLVNDDLSRYKGQFATLRVTLYELEQRLKNGKLRPISLNNSFQNVWRYGRSGVNNGEGEGEGEGEGDEDNNANANANANGNGNPNTNTNHNPNTNTNHNTHHHTNTNAKNVSPPDYNVIGEWGSRENNPDYSWITQTAPNWHKYRLRQQGRSHGSKSYSKLLKASGASWMPTDWKEKIKSLMSNDDEYQALICKIEEWGAVKARTESKHKLENKQIIWKLNELETQLDLIRVKNKELESRNKVHVYQINEWKNEQKINQRKWNDVQHQIYSLQGIHREKDQEIKLLSYQWSTLKKIAKNGASDVSDVEVSKYINKIKWEEGVEDGVDID